MNDRRQVVEGGAGSMFLSAAIFGFFGFVYYRPVYDESTPLFIGLLDATLKGSAIAFLLSALLTLARPLPGNVLFGACSLLSAVLLVVVAVMDFADPQLDAFAYSPYVLFLFGVWNGHSGWGSLRALGPLRRA